MWDSYPQKAKFEFEIWNSYPKKNATVNLFQFMIFNQFPKFGTPIHKKQNLNLKEAQFGGTWLTLRVDKF